MVGRTPEYLGKKVEAREMKLAMLALLIHPIMILGSTGLFAATRLGHQGRPTTRGRTAFRKSSTSSAPPRPTTARASRGWATPTGSTTTPIAGPLQPALGHRHGPGDADQPLHSDHRPDRPGGSLAAKKPTPFTAGTLRTDTLTFGFVLLGTILLVGALLFLPAAVLGPVAEHLGPMPFGG